MISDTSVMSKRVGSIILDGEKLGSNVQLTQFMPKDRRVYLELDYKCNTPFL